MGKAFWIAVIALLALGTVLSFESNARWEHFTVKHNCHVFAFKADTYVPMVTVASNGAVTNSTVYVPGAKGWRCDDGKEYWR